MTTNLAQMTRAEAEAARAAEKAQAAAAEAQRKAAEAKQRADEERQAANLSYLAQLDRETPAQLKKARAAASDALAAFDKAVVEDGNVFSAYRAYIDEAVNLWKLQKALADQRAFFGKPAQMPQQPGFSFVNDITHSFGRYAVSRISEAEQAAKEERQLFLAGETSS